MALNQPPQLRQIVYIRALIAGFLVLAAGFGSLLFDLSGVRLALASVLGLMVAMVLLSALLLRNRTTLTEPAILAQLALDGLLYAGFLALTGGASNPLVFVLLMPLIVSAMTLPERYTLGLSLLFVGVYSLLLFVYRPLEGIGYVVAGDNRFMSLHVLGMWVNFLLAVGIIDWFMVRMQRALRARDAQLHAEREKRIRDQNLLTLATVTAGTAHELGTPLSTMRVVLGDLREEQPHLSEDLDLLEQQVARCSNKLRTITQHVQADESSIVRVTELLNRVLSEWQLVRPDARWHLEIAGDDPVPDVSAGIALEQALLNLLNNAAEASNGAPVDIQLDWDSKRILVSLHDQGPGISAQAMDTLGQPFITTKGGLGIGLFLTTSTLRQQDGDVRLYNHPEGGTITDIHLKPEHGHG